MTFREIFDGPHGTSVVSDNPEQDLTQELNTRIKFNSGCRPNFVRHDDGAVTAKSDGVMDLTFQPADDWQEGEQQEEQA